MARINLNRIDKTSIGSTFTREQVGFREYRPCVDQINNFRIIAERRKVSRDEFFYQKAFDCLMVTDQVLQMTIGSKE